MHARALRQSIKINRIRERTMAARIGSSMAVAAYAVAAMAATSASAQKKYDPGADDTEIRIGNIMPYSGPASSYGVIGKAEAAYFNKVNAEGGINGRTRRSSRRASWWKATRCC
jgi:ABC-type branched-subunit amino acid transport system substrate-binding protein